MSAPMSNANMTCLAITLFYHGIQERTYCVTHTSNLNCSSAFVLKVLESTNVIKSSWEETSNSLSFQKQIKLYIMLFIKQSV